MESEYNIIKNVLNKEDIKLMINIVNKILNMMIPEYKELLWHEKYYKLKNKDIKLKSRFYDLLQNHHFIKLLTYNKILPLVKNNLNISIENLLNENIGIRFDDDSNDHLEAFHQDSGLISNDSFIFWLPLTDCQIELGGIKIIEKTSKLKNIKQEIYEEFRNDFGVSKELVNKYKDNIKDIILNKGDLIIFKSTLVHGTRKILKEGHVRATLISRWCDIQNTNYNDSSKSLKIFNL